MSVGRVPSPDFDDHRYERPNADWVCGHACDGCPCRIGPAPNGTCRATTECTPLLIKKEGEAKGTWKCTRPSTAGGACPQGPNPDGTCCKTIEKCQPVRSIRAKRGLVVRVTIAATVAVLLIGLGGTLRESFINPAPLSRSHSGPEFERLALTHGGGKGCVSCHAEANQDFTTLVKSAVAASKVSLTVSKITSDHPKDFSRMDKSCIECHTKESFHQANMPRDTSCTVCHTEHRGAGSLPPVAASNCTDCHGNSNDMKIAAARLPSIPAAAFEKKVAPGVVVHASPRPAEGLTKVFNGFTDGHPEFQVVREKSLDTNNLKFNHKMHLTGDIPVVNGKPLDCGYCHQPDASGAFMQRFSFERNCRACHALNFDENTPGLELPHGDATFARAFIRSLPTQYADYARKHPEQTRGLPIEEYVKQQMWSLRQRTISGENLERSVFFADATWAEASKIAGHDGPARAKFAGCAYCHTVTDRGESAPLITKPETPDRWMLHSRFNHEKHSTMHCVECHNADPRSSEGAENRKFMAAHPDKLPEMKSTRTSDILMPTQESCTKCHSKPGGVRDDCSACHGYHNTPLNLPAGQTTAALLK